MDAYRLFCEGDALEEAGDLLGAKAAFQEGAVLGYTPSMNRLALMYDNGVGGDVDKSRAMQWYRRGWRQKDPGAANNIAVLYREKGRFSQMAQWFRRGANLGDGGASLALAKCYLEGVGVRKSLPQAARCLAEAIGSNNIHEEAREEAREIMSELDPHAL